MKIGEAVTKAKIKMLDSYIKIFMRQKAKLLMSLSKPKEGKKLFEEKQEDQPIEVEEIEVEKPVEEVKQIVSKIVAKEEKKQEEYTGPVVEV